MAGAEAPVTTVPGDVLTARQRLSVPRPRRWGPDDPYLYTCRATLLDGGEVLDEESTTFGIRSLTVDPIRGLRINGEPVLLRGACVHHDNGLLGAATIGRAEERRVELLKEAGFNAIRSAHNPLSVPMLEACDRLGVLVMDETFDMWTQPKSEHDYALRFPDWWEADVEAMVRKDRNHPSVILYSIGNEVPEAGTPMGARVGRALAEKIRSLDPRGSSPRPSAGCWSAGPSCSPQLAEGRRARRRGEPDEETGVNTAMTQIADRLNELMNAPVVAKNSAQTASYLDVVGYNYMETRFGTDGELYPNRVIVGSETHPAAIDTGWAGGPPAPARDRRLHLDRLGLPRRGRDRAHRLRPSRTERPGSSRSSASTRGARRGAGTSTSRVSAARSRTTARSSSACGPTPTSPCSGPSTTARPVPGRPGPGPTWSRAGAGPDTRGAGHGRGLRRRGRGRAAGERPLRRPAAQRRDARATGRRSRRPTSRACWRPSPGGTGSKSAARRSVRPPGRCCCGPPVDRAVDRRRP